MVLVALLIAVLSLAVPRPALAADLVGQASVIDGDTIEVHGQRIRFFGIDAPESRQLCEAAGQQYRCGQKAALVLADEIGQRTVSCQQRDVDRYGRVVAVCSAGGVDLNGWMVRQGWALAYRQYSMAYVSDEEAAQAARAGIWRGTFQPPWAWRAAQAHAAPAGNEATGQCLIKGNISSSGKRIYHVPGGRFYEATKIDPSKGERWFCTEAEAQAAGWRRSRQ